MSVTSQCLASGPDCRVDDVVCAAGPRDRPFEERHEAACIAIVMSGSFEYRTRQGGAVLGLGALLLGNAGACFECGHEHATGDRCLSFHFTQRLLEAVASAVPGIRKVDFHVPHLPPVPELAPLLSEAEAARDQKDAAAWEEIALRLCGAVAVTLADRKPSRVSPTSRDARRITEALRCIEAEADTRLSLGEMARQAGMSAYHFLRVFRQIVGVTPHQYVLRTRLHRAAIRLRRTKEPISSIALEAGFDDLSTFNRRFRRVMGVSPSLWRAK
jgi:AraC-like DNA-binding protein